MFISLPPHPSRPALVEGEFSQSNPQADLVSNLSLSCLEWEVPRELLLHRSELIPPLVLGFERFEENKYTSIRRRRMIVPCKEEDMEKNSYGHTDTQTH